MTTYCFSESVLKAFDLYFTPHKIPQIIVQSLVGQLLPNLIFRNESNKSHLISEMTTDVIAA